ncbi:MAG: HPP family protein [Acidiferrobacteraceae bacterium]
MSRWFNSMRGGRGAAPPVASWPQIALAWLGGFLAIGTVAYVADAAHAPLLLGSFGASCVLLFGFPESPFSQPRSVIGGHFLSSLTGLIAISCFGATWWSTALALGTAISVMQLTRTVHPPAGSNPVIIMLAHAGWSFLLRPTLFGVLILQTAALLYHSFVKRRCYPTYWL